MDLREHVLRYAVDDVRVVKRLLPGESEAWWGWRTSMTRRW